MKRFTERFWPLLARLVFRLCQHERVRGELHKAGVEIMTHEKMITSFLEPDYDRTKADFVDEFVIVRTMKKFGIPEVRTKTILIELTKAHMLRFRKEADVQCIGGWRMFSRVPWVTY